MTMKPAAENAMKILAGEQAKVPFIIWGPAPFITASVGETQKDFYLNPERKMQIQMKAVDLFPDAWVIPGVWPDFGAVLEPSMFGSKVLYFDNDAPRALPIISETDEIDKVTFDPKNSLLPEMIRQYEYMWKHLPQHYIDDYGFLDGVGYALGPVETACLLMGMSNFLISTIEDPEPLHKLLDVITDGLMYSLREQEKVNGKLKKIYLPDHSSNQMGRAAFEEFCLPYYKRIVDEYPDCKFVLYHNEGRQIHVGDLLHKFGATITHFGDPVEKLAPLLDPNIVLMGNLHPINTMLNKTPDEIYQEATDLLRQAPKGRIWLSTGGGLAPNTPLENVRAAIRAAMDFE